MGHSGDVPGTSRGVCCRQRLQPQRAAGASPGGRGWAALSKNLVMDNCELEVIEILVGVESVKLLNKPAMIPCVPPGHHRTGLQAVRDGAPEPRAQALQGLLRLLPWVLQTWHK